jgi:hypothetical protein
MAIATTIVAAQRTVHAMTNVRITREMDGGAGPGIPR